MSTVKPQRSLFDWFINVFCLSFIVLIFSAFSANAGVSQLYKSYLCYRANHMTHVWLVTPDKSEHHFKVSNAFFRDFYNKKSGEQSSLGFHVINQTFQPACFAKEEDVELGLKKLSLISIEAIKPIEDKERWGSYYRERFTDYIGTDNNGFKIFENKSAQDRKSGYSFDELLIPPEDYFSSTTIILCSNTVNSKAAKYERIGCRAIQNSTPNLMVQYTFHSSNFDDLLVLDHKVNQFLQDITISKTQKE